MGFGKYLDMSSGNLRSFICNNNQRSADAPAVSRDMDSIVMMIDVYADKFRHQTVSSHPSKLVQEF